MYFGCFIMQNKKTYLYLINFTITNELYENTSISLKPNVNHCTATVNNIFEGGVRLFLPGILTYFNLQFF